MALQFTQEEIENELSDIVKTTTREKIARGSGLSESYIKRQFNPNDEQASCAFRTLQIACTLDDIDAETGDAFWQALTEKREMSKKRKPSSRTDLGTETGKLNTEVAEFVTAKLENKPFNEQMSELLDVERQFAEVKQAYLDEFNRLKDESKNVSSLKIANFGSR